MAKPCTICYKEIICSNDCQRLLEEKEKRSGPSGLAGAEQMDRPDQEIEAEHINSQMKDAYEANDHEAARKIMEGDNNERSI